MEALRFFLAFAVAVVSLHAALGAFRLAWGEPTAERWAAAGTWLALLVASWVAAGYVVYAADRRSGRVRRRVAVYERWAARRGGKWP